MVVDASAIMAEKSVKASIVRLKGTIAISKMPFSNSMRLVSDLFQILRKELFLCAHPDWILKRNRVGSEPVSKSIATGEELRAGRTASDKSFFKL
jgi:hypothetical protein